MDQETEQTATETASTDPTRDDLIAAVREAGGTESVDAAAEEAAATEAPPAPVEEAAPDPYAKVEGILKAREEAHKKTRDAQDRAAAITRDAEERRDRMIEEARAEAKRIAAEELAAERAKFRTSPTAAIRALAEGGDIQSVIDDVIREGTPEARAIAQAREEARQAREEAKIGKSAKDELEAFKAEQQREREAAYVAQVKSQFLGTVASEEKAPYLHARWDPEEVFDRCNTLCVSWQKDGLTLGKDFDQADLVAYLEKQSRDRLSKVSGTPAHQSGAGAPAKEPGIAPKSVANGTRTLSAAQGSERRTSPRPLSEMTAEQQRQALIEEVAAARRANPTATS